MTAVQLIERCLYAGIELRRDGADLLVDGPEDALTPEFQTELATHKAEVLTMLDRADGGIVHTDRGPVVDLVRVLGPLSAEEVASVPAGSLYRKAEPDATHARVRENAAATVPAAAAVHVSHIERESRHRQQPMRDTDRHCAACKTPAPAEGPLPFAWDVHALPGAAELVLSCGSECRAALGLRERKSR